MHTLPRLTRPLQATLALILAALITLAMALSTQATAHANPPLPHLGAPFTTATGQTYHFNPLMPMCGDVGMGTQGECVAILQTALNAYSNARITVDGQAGPLTIGALSAYQISRGLPDLRYADFTTRMALMVDYYKTYPAEANRPVFDLGRLTDSVYLTRTETQALGDAYNRWQNAAAAGASVGGAIVCDATGGGVVISLECGVIADRLFNHYGDTVKAADQGYGCLRIRFTQPIPPLGTAIYNVYNDGGTHCRI